MYTNHSGNSTTEAGQMAYDCSSRASKTFQDVSYADKYKNRRLFTKNVLMVIEEVVRADLE